MHVIPCLQIQPTAFHHHRESYFDMLLDFCSGKGFASALPRLLLIEAPIQPQLPPAPQPIIIAAAAVPEDADKSLEYFVNNSDAPLCEWTRSSKLQVPLQLRLCQTCSEAFINGQLVFPVFEASADPHPPPPSPPPAYADSAARARH